MVANTKKGWSKLMAQVGKAVVTLYNFLIKEAATVTAALGIVLFPLLLDVMLHFDHSECTVWAYDGGDASKYVLRENTDNATAIYYAGVVCWATYARFFASQKTIQETGLPDPAYWMASFLTGFGGAALIGSAIFYLLLGVLTADCQVTGSGSVPEDKNGQVHSIPLTAGTLLALLIFSAVMKSGSVRSDKETAGDARRLYIDLTGGMAFCVTRFVFALLGYMMFSRSHADFGRDYTVTPTSQCAGAMTRASLDADKSRMFENIEVGRNKNGAWHTNDHLDAIFLAALVLASIEMGFRLIQVFMRMRQNSTIFLEDGEKTTGFTMDGVSRAIGVGTEIILSICVYSFVMEHEVASCSVFNPSNKEVRTLYEVACWFVVQSFVVVWARNEYFRVAGMAVDDKAYMQVESSNP
jgi:hypothetical protein